jgi:aldehyde dehydrogenase (NAD+)
MDNYKLFINGNFVDAASGKTFESIDPGTGLAFASVAMAGKADAEAAIAAARKAFDSGVWSGLTPQARMAMMHKFSDQISQQFLRLAMTESMDSGQIMGLAGSGPMMGTVLMRNLSLAAATEFKWEEEIKVSGSLGGVGREFIRREPRGVCVGIIPWNFPMYMAFWKIVPAMVMGNTIVLKPASATPLSALIIAEAAKAAGIPDGVINVITGSGGELGRVLCTHPDVDKIAFTGSTEIGREIMQMGSSTIKKVTLELGGKSANIILDDADMDLAVEGACFGTFFHQGQICESGTRVLVSSKISDQFLERMKKRAEALRVGYQMDPNSHLGPLVSKEQLATVERYVQIGKDEGAQLVTGGKRVEVPGMGGYYYAPTIFANVNNKMRIAQEEIFGPVVSVIKYDSDEEAVAIANDSIYGLGGGVFSTNMKRAQHIAEGVRTGTMWINNYHVFADFCPFGGYKQSGVGRELGLEGLAEFTQIKRVHMSAIGDYKSNMMFGILADNRKFGLTVFTCPTQIYAGHGMIMAAQKAVVDLGCRRAFVMTDPGVKKAGLAELVVNSLGNFFVGMYDQTPADPDLEAVDAATELARQSKADCIVSVGGGSVIDAAKAVCVTLKNGGKADDHMRLMSLSGPQTPHIVIPTTSGTGSEVTNVAVLTSHGAVRKSYLLDRRVIPDVAILDPQFTISMPPGLTMNTAMDAMTHAIEAATSNMSNDMTDGLALKAIRLIKDNLPLVLADGKNEQARLNMQVAAVSAGLAFANAQVGVVHAMAHSIGALYHAPHGAICGVLLPHAMRYNVDFATAKLVQVAHALGVNPAGKQDREVALAAADAIDALMQKIGHPTKLRDLGVPDDGAVLCAFHALVDPAVRFNARPVKDPNDVVQMLTQAY